MVGEGRKLKIDDMKPGEEWELDCRDEKTGKQNTIRFRIIEVGWYPTPVKPGALMQGVRCQSDSSGEGILFFLELESARKVYEFSEHEED